MEKIEEGEVTKEAKEDDEDMEVESDTEEENAIKDFAPPKLRGAVLELGAKTSEGGEGIA